MVLFLVAMAAARASRSVKRMRTMISAMVRPSTSPRRCALFWLLMKGSLSSTQLLHHGPAQGHERALDFGHGGPALLDHFGGRLAVLPRDAQIGLDGGANVGDRLFLRIRARAECRHGLPRRLDVVPQLPRGGPHGVAELVCD